MRAGVIVRRAQAGDLAGVLRLERGSREAPHWDEELYREMLHGSGQEVLRRALFVAVEGDQVAGFAVGAVVLEEAELESIAVDEAWRRRGVGRALSEAVCGWAVAEGATEMRLEVRAANVAAGTLYARMGFTECGVRPSYYVDPVEDAVLMSKGLR